MRYSHLAHAQLRFLREIGIPSQLLDVGSEEDVCRKIMTKFSVVLCIIRNL